MANAILRERLVANIANAIRQAAAVGTVEHAGSKGTFREIAVQNLLAPVLRGHLGVTSGVVIDSRGHSSPQLDVIVYSSDVLPPIMVDRGIACVPVEACIHAFEIKSKLTASEIGSCLRAARALNRLTVLPPGPKDAEEQLRGPTQLRINVPVIFSIFAFGTDLTDGGKSELDRFTEVASKELDAHDRARVLVHDLCVVGRGYWKNPLGKVFHVTATDSHDEVIEQMITATDSWPARIGSRGSANLGPYFFTSAAANVADET